MSDEENLNLRGSIRDLRNVAKTLNAANFNFSMNALEKFLDGITVDKPAEPPEDILKPLLVKFLCGDYNFSSREIRNLPFIIYDSSITYNEAIKILRFMDFSRTSHLRGVLSVYLLNYDGSKKTELLRQKLNAIRNVDTVSLRKIFAASDKLFANERFMNMARLFADKLSVTNSLETIGLSNFYKTSKFIQASLRNFFRMPKFITDQFVILDELDAEFDTYQNIFPDLADAMIQNVVVNQNFGKKKCIDVFYRRLGDPRFGDRRFSWDRVSEKSKEIFKAWIAEDDLRIFFEITREVLRKALALVKTQEERDKAIANIKMWDEREFFWKFYLPYIGNTWVVLGSNAQEIAYQLKDMRIHGKLLGNYDKDKSGFLFQIGSYIFAEWSHNGALRVYPAQRVKDYIGNNISKTKMMEVPVADDGKGRWVHKDSRDENSGEIISWQHKVSKWLEKNCGIHDMRFES